MSLEPTALLSDTFGTMVHWRGSIIAAGERLTQRCGLDEIDWGKFADEWRRERHTEPIAQIVRSEREWESVDQEKLRLPAVMAISPLCRSRPYVVLVTMVWSPSLVRLLMG